MAMITIETFNADSHSDGTWGSVGECSYCNDRATHQRRSRRQGRKVTYTALCEAHAQNAIHRICHAPESLTQELAAAERRHEAAQKALTTTNQVMTEALSHYRAMLVPRRAAYREERAAATHLRQVRHSVRKAQTTHRTLDTME